MRVAIKKKTDHATRVPWTPGKYDVVCSAHNDISSPIKDIAFISYVIDASRGVPKVITDGTHAPPISVKIVGEPHY
jgi:hypothetical protein